MCVVELARSSDGVVAARLNGAETERVSTERTSAATRFREAQNLAISMELQAYCEAQRDYVLEGSSRAELRKASRWLAREARRRRLQAETMLLALQVGGCYRSHHLYGEAAATMLGRYHEALSELLFFYHGPEARPSERRMAPRPEKP